MSADDLHAKVLTVSDGVVAGTRDDASGRALVEQLTSAGFEVVAHEVTADGAEAVATALTRLSDGLRRVDRHHWRHWLRATRPDPRGHARRDRT